MAMTNTAIWIVPLIHYSVILLPPIGPKLVKLVNDRVLTIHNACAIVHFDSEHANLPSDYQLSYRNGQCICRRNWANDNDQAPYIPFTRIFIDLSFFYYLILHTLKNCSSIILYFFCFLKYKTCATVWVAD